ncbi:nematicidal protein 2 [Photorhabdus temperata]|nr:nematicidal protein 2 [Photorhabdus temperata]EQC00482.1 nematicidal protein 2 [Photorhabdus temperata subsp. temperata M1021]
MAAISAASVTSLAVGALGVASDVTAIVSGALEEASPQASSILGWVSLGTGVIGFGVAVAKAGVKAVGKLDALSERVATIQREGLGGKGAVNAPKRMAQNITGVDPKNVLFSQDSVSAVFKEENGVVRDVADLIEEFREFPLTYKDEVEPIKTVKFSDLSQFPKVQEKFPNNTHPNSLITIDNRRLYAARRAGISEIRSQPATHNELMDALNQSKFTTKYGGKSIDLRVKRKGLKLIKIPLLQ